MRLHTFLILFALAIPLCLNGQNKRVVKADRAFEMRQYTDAIDYYRKAMKKVKKDKKETARLVFRIGVCYRMTNNSKKAESFFKRAMRGNYADSLAVLYYADALKQNGKWEEAKTQYLKYAEQYPDDPRGKLGAESIALTLEMLDNPNRFVVENMKKINSKEEDYAPAWGDSRYSSLVFSSSRDGVIGEELDPWTGLNFTDLFIVYQDRKGDWSTPGLFDKGPVNTMYNEGAASVVGNGSVVYFTRCRSVEGSDLGCRIYRATRNGQEWSEPSEVKLVNDSTVSMGHPSVSNDELEIYFSSDLPGGLGGKDIWVARRSNTGMDFEEPENLGPTINTPFNEIFPFLREDNILFFSSDGHPGMGGLDIFKSEQTGALWSKPENMGNPVNSTGDDFGIIFKGTENQGFLTSNRAGSRSDDIYSFSFAPVFFTLQGTIRDNETKVVLPKTTIQLIGSDGTMVQSESDKDGKYLFDKTVIKENTTYEILVSREKYFSARGQETTVGVEKSRDFVYDFYLEAIPQKPVELPEILYDLAKWDLKPQYQDSLNGLIITLQDNPTIIVELASHTDARASDEFNDTLSQRRAQSVVDYLIQRGINPNRLVAKGYGERVPRELTKDIVRDGYTFKAGTILTEAFINSLPDDKMKETAHQLNRRTEFKVLSDDFVPGENTIEIRPRIQVITDDKDKEKEKPNQ